MLLNRFVFGGVLSFALTSSAFAGFIVGTDPDLITYTGTGSITAPAVGGTLAVTNQPLASYTPDTPADPQIAPGDISNFLFSLSLGVTSVNSGAIQTTGTYSVYYDVGSNGTPDILVSSGSADLFLSSLSGGLSVATGQLRQILGPANPAFADLAYGNNDNLVLDGGLLDSSSAPATLALTLRQNAVAPEPASLGLLAAGGILMLRRRRAR